MKIGILGGTFDPPHKGHKLVAGIVKKELGLDRIIFIPTKDPPHKVRPKVSPQHRFFLTRLLVRGKKGFLVSDLEFKRPGKSYTADTVQELRKLYPQDKLFWIIGADALLYMPRGWKEGYKILDKCQFVVVVRPGYSLKSVPGRILQKVIIVKNRARDDISSTEIRRYLKSGKSIKGLLTPQQEIYIKRKHLYKT
ncbi:MAG: nicotinate (nicotinamide) nucleotide adenylyltransferase [Candidatus Sungiibacteriota bacterium]|uniref:Probable nicotinate-nucleotide adenylyltransferase n=1 Tax=Candidatus Sungiibacteriota bacterium TaxID=2750080 RepID=A0A7T5RJ97_9BACT|nr:MAG: nicotinate (nicotinamide) nucleotide adenylyltransferase [Candidatus Sungbacteria bacterium]